MTKLANLKQIDLIASDFDVILKPDYSIYQAEYGLFKIQYKNNSNCPIARALKRKGFKKVEVFSTRLTADGETRHIYGGLGKILDACIAIGMGAESSPIHFELKS